MSPFFVCLLEENSTGQVSHLEGTEPQRVWLVTQWDVIFGTHFAELIKEWIEGDVPACLWYCWVASLSTVVVMIFSMALASGACLFCCNIISCLLNLCRSPAVAMPHQAPQTLSKANSRLAVGTNLHALTFHTWGTDSMFSPDSLL